MKLAIFDPRQKLNVEDTYRELYIAARHRLIKEGIYKSDISAHHQMLKKVNHEFIAAELPKRKTKGKRYYKK